MSRTDFVKGLADMEAEKAVLSLVFSTSGEAFADYEIPDCLFFYPPHLTLLNVARELFAKGVKVDFFAVSHSLNDKGQTDVVGGLGSVSELFYRVPGSPDHFIGLLRQAHAMRALRLLWQDAEIQMEEGEEVQSLIASLSAGIASLDPSADVQDVKQSAYDQAMERVKQIESGTKRAGVPTGLEFWDYFFGGIVPGMMVGLAARPGFGKTSLAEQVVTKLLREERPVCVFAQDMSPTQFLQRIACREAKVSKFDFDHGRVQKDELEDVKNILNGLLKSPLRLHCRNRLTADQLIAIARKDARKYGCRSFWLDHVQTLRGPKGEEPRITYGNASKLIRNFVDTEHVTFISLAHLNREAAKGATVNNVKEFDDMLGDVDGMILLDSLQDQVKLSPHQDWQMQFKVGKNRNGPTGKEEVIYNRKLMAFEAIPPTLKFQKR